MEDWTYVGIALAMVGAGYCLVWMLLGAIRVYNRLHESRNRAYEAFSGVEVQLTRRHELIPNLVAVAKGYLEHESRMLSRLTTLRTDALRLEHANDKVKLERRLDVECDIDSCISEISTVIEGYPNLKADTVMRDISETISDCEAHLAAARRFYNSAVSELNTMVSSFPVNLFCSWIRFEELPFYRHTSGDRATGELV